MRERNSCTATNSQVSNHNTGKLLTAGFMCSSCHCNVTPNTLRSLTCFTEVRGDRGRELTSLAEIQNQSDNKGKLRLHHLHLSTVVKRRKTGNSGSFCLRLALLQAYCWCLEEQARQELMLYVLFLFLSLKAFAHCWKRIWRQVKFRAEAHSSCGYL